MLREKVKTYLETIQGKKAFMKYYNICQIEPQNLYVDNTDYVERYIEEHILLENCFSYFYDKEFSLEEIFEAIPEIMEYYPYFGESEITKMKFDEEFYVLLHKKVIGFYSNVNPRRYGEYYTSLEMINAALPEVDIELKNKVIDPSCGSGFILYAYVTVLLDKYNKNVNWDIMVKNLQENIYGFDVFPSAVIMTKLLLGYSIYRVDGYKKRIFYFNNIQIRNTLETLKCMSKEDFGIPLFDVILGNPPFFRVNPNGVKNICNCTQYGHHYAHSLFLHWTLQYLKESGTFCLILPESMLTGFYYQKVRKELIDNAMIKNIIFNKEHEKMFDVQQDVMILIAQKGVKEKYYFTSSSDTKTGKIKKYMLPISVYENKYSVIPAILNDSDIKLLRDVSMNEIVSDLSDVSISTGNFVWNQNKGKCFMENGYHRKPLISGPSIVDGRVLVEHNRTNTFMYCEPDKVHYTLTDKAIVFRRMSPMENDKRFIGAIIDPDLLGATGYVVENHVNIIKGSNLKLNKLYDFLDSREFNDILRLFCRTNQVSVSDIKTVFEILSKMRKVELDEKQGRSIKRNRKIG